MIQSTRRRRGTVLIQFALIVFALMALAAIVIDLGFVRLTQQEMQTGTDAAALEGLRWRDEPVPASWTLTGNSDQDRRQLASQLNALQYDADYNLTTTDSQYGAGPVISFTGGTTEANALQSVTGTSVYKPDLQLNGQDNDQAGDMVAGTFTPLAPPQPPTEAQDYTRNDFMVSSASATAPSFLVRMRRTNDPRETASNTSGVSSLGPSLPLLFGRGSMIAGGDPNAGYNVRFHGLTIRSTSIADARLAKTIGPAYPVALYPNATPAFNGLSGAAPFALSLASWNGLTATTTATVKNDGSLSGLAGAGQIIRATSLAAQVGANDGTITVTPAAGATQGPPPGFPPPPFFIRIDNSATQSAELLKVTAVDPQTELTWTVQRAQQGTQAQQFSANAPVLLHAAMTIGFNVTALGSGQSVALDQLIGANVSTFVPLYDDASMLIVGFGGVKWTASTLSGNLSLNLTRQQGALVPQNATAVFALPLMANYTQPLTAAQLGTVAESGTVLADHASLTDSLLVPALVR
jgi:Putative Flp pilus-assembly TadE/G-like